MITDNDHENPDRMSPLIALLGYGSAALVIFLLFFFANPVTG